MVKIGANAVAAKMNPLGAAENMKDLFGGGDNKSGDDKTEKTGKTEKAEEPAEKNDEADLALIYSDMVIKPTEAMVELLSGPDGVEWELVTGVGKKDDDKDKKASKNKGRWNVEMIKTMLEKTRKSVRSSKVDRKSANAKTLLSAISDVLKVKPPLRLYDGAS